jgi:hypothetical protein
MDRSGGLTVVSLATFGNAWALAASIPLVFLATFAAIIALSLTFFRKYFLLYGRELPSIGSALQSGKGQEFEFKRGVVDEDLLKSITAFANTNDGAVFIGVADDG